jgi:MFS superfamily sulfate permease-like transporter
MVRKHLEYYFRHLHHDVSAGAVVFLIALPLNLGIALASGAPLVSGLITGIISGLVVAWASERLTIEHQRTGCRAECDRLPCSGKTR